jgi:hypothetical protein
MSTSRRPHALPRESGKVITKPMIPDQLLALLRCADEMGQWLRGDEWLIPNRKPWLVKSAKRRGHKLIYETVVRVADRAGFARTCTRSAVRSRSSTTSSTPIRRPRSRSCSITCGWRRLAYLRRKNKPAAIETVRDCRLRVSGA